ncbi:Cleavage stimulation factor, 3' pre-RNA subunit 2 [Seminavis robusta]|uniref:Cleavage stimulation factor, 3' pre-RNA subunit 2 n=1 Tax=Seminavis robusta TaxID=568900 RepID=A0A9N8HJZ0_9STRA|nr:Cleavage stimulation factor, 3' pre-RNA subunit 2 [Seminavis robusta]|eukprot:Sro695_g188690.1 Cleavage stimulation factor, 3' pre-RNA subunit 2 (265) ;mRNA; f:24927-25721
MKVSHRSAVGVSSRILLLVMIPTVASFVANTFPFRYQQSTVLFGFKRATIVDKYKKKSNKNNKSKEASVKKLSASNDLLTNHRHRLSMAGKIGALRYADPTKIFIGNLNNHTKPITKLILPLVATPWDIAKIQIVRDWKTGDSKGYAFVGFAEPIFATLCLQELRGHEFLGRVLSVKPAKSKSESPLRQEQRQGQLHLKALRRAQNPPPPPPAPKHEDPAFLAFLDPDLAVGLEAVGTDDEDDTDDDEYDGWEVPGSAPPKGFG